MLGVKGEVDKSLIEVYDGYVGDGYGQPTDSMVEALEMFARSDAILLDPVYSGKGAAGMIDLIRNGTLKKGEVTAVSRLISITCQRLEVGWLPRVAR